MIEIINNTEVHHSCSWEGHQNYLQSHLAYEALKSLKEWATSEAIVDYTLDRKALSAHQLLALSLTLSRHFKAIFKSHSRVGIVLPPGIAGTLANLGLLFANKIPINLNFTLGPEIIKDCMQKAEITAIITTHALQQKCPHFPFPQNTVDIVELLKNISKIKFIALLGLVKILPTHLLVKLLNIPQKGGDNEASILFTSGSLGTPKGVILTHKNILSNILQIDSIGVIPSHEILIASLPIFHSFGFTVTMWYTLIKKVKTVCVPSPLDFKKIAQAIHNEGVTVYMATPTFLKPYLKRIEPELLKSLKCVIAGAEKTPEGLHKAWETKFNSAYLEGYGLTETTPVVAVNLPFYNTAGMSLRRDKSVGQLFPEMSAKIVDTETLEDLPLGSQGLLAFKGPNVFLEYFKDPELTQRSFKNGWYITGDLGRIDKDGFIYVEGRLSRFSKIGGEMVPHVTIEQKILEALKIDDESWVIAVTSKPDPEKGEALVILTTVDFDFEFLKHELHKIGLSNLWIPKHIKKINAIPLLASGKLDIKTCQKLAF